MSEFSAAANLSIEIDDGELRSARRTIEQELGDVSVGTGSMRPDGGQPMGGGAGRGQRAGILDASRKTFGAVEDLVGLAEERNELLDDLSDAGVGGGGGGSGSGTAFLSGAGARSILGGLGGGAVGGLGAGAIGGLGAAGVAGGLAGGTIAGSIGILELLKRRRFQEPTDPTRLPTGDDIPDGAPGAGVPTGVIPVDAPESIPVEIDRDQLAQRVRDASGGGRAGDVNTDEVIENVRRNRRLAGRVREASRGERAGDVNVDVIIENLRADEQTVRREAEEAAQRLVDRVLAQSGAGTQPRNPGLTRQ